MPKSKVRRKSTYTPQRAAAATTERGPSHPAYVAIMLGIGLLGLLWLVVYYLAADVIPLMSALTYWNFAIGFGLIVVSLIMTMKWR